MTQGSLFDDDGAGTSEVVVYTDGASRGNPGAAAIGAVVLDPSTDPPTVLARVSERIGETTNNVAEYRAVIAGLEAAAPFGARRMRLRADSLIVVQQLRGTFKVKTEHLRPLHKRALALLERYDDVDIGHVPRSKNAEADALANAALDS